MAGDRDHFQDSLTDPSPGMLAEEDVVDRRVLWRLASWGVCAVGAVTLAVYTNQSAIDVRRTQLTAAADLVRQSQQIQSVARDGQSEIRRLAAAIETLNGDRDRLYTRVSGLEQELNSVTGSISRQTLPAAASATLEAAPKSQLPVATLAKSDALSPATPLMAARSFMAPPDPSASKLTEPEASAPPETTAAIPTEAAGEATAPPVTVLHTEFGIDIGVAPSVQGLRLLWKKQIKARPSLEGLRPIMVVRELAGAPGVQFHLVAGPLSDAAAAARLCASLPDAGRTCEPAVYDGQRLALTSDVAPAAGMAKPLRKPRPRVIRPVDAVPKPQASLSPAPR